MSRDEDRLRVPEMLGFDSLTRIIVGYLKSGASGKEVSYEDVANVSGISATNVRRNAPFFAQIDLLEGSRGRYKLTDAGHDYTQALDWGRIKDASSILQKTLKDNDLIAPILAYVDINKPVTREDLRSRIAIIAGVSSASRFKTGINSLIELILTSNLLIEDEKGNISTSDDKRISEETRIPISTVSIPVVEEKVSTPVPISIVINLDADSLDEESLRKIISIVKNSVSETDE